MSERAVEVGVRVEFGREVAPADVIAGADLVVAADGVRSRTRQLHEHDFGARVEPARNQFVWLGTSKVFSSFHYAFVHTEAGWIWWYAYGYSNDRSTVVVECSPETCQGLGLDQLGRQETLDALQRLFAADLDGHPLLAQPRGSDSVGWQRFPVVTNDAWVHQNTALMGDAAHTTHFSIGSGTMLALEDAIALADSLQRHPDLVTALAEYDTSRRAAVAPTQRDALRSLQWYENVPRYAALGPDRLAAAMHRRRSPVLARTPPALYFGLRSAIYNPVTRGLRRRVSALRPALQTPA
jgi:2-polyprenyl-6-methoxyphenol hydroxylase-like FAD-dependent oxidoreductase